MPYKHIAAHLKKTELACRLHYHQLSHGSNRRKRASSMTSSGSSTSESPLLPLRMTSPVNEAVHLPATPPTYNYSPQSHHIQLPSASSLLSRSASNSPSRAFSHPVAILPKPIPSRRPLTDSAATQTLRLDCALTSTPMTVAHVDKDRLQRVYESHRNSFWNVIASEYGRGVSPLLLEETWKQGVAPNGPPTPCVSPELPSLNRASCHYSSHSTQAPTRLPTPTHESKSHVTSISAILGIDANPKSPKEREMVRRIEESRGMY